MAVDFDALVLAPLVEIFSRRLIIDPLTSMPGQPPYAARGVWTTTSVDIPLDGGHMLSSRNITLGVRLSEFPTPPMKGDRVEIPADGSLARIGICEIDDETDDGQGGARWTLKNIAP